MVLEAQYQASLSAAVNKINTHRKEVCVELCGYLLEELRDAKNFEAFKKDVATGAAQLRGGWRAGGRGGITTASRTLPPSSPTANQPASQPLTTPTPTPTLQPTSSSAP